jgi:hypothetical protein
MMRSDNWRQIVDGVGTIAVVVSLAYVGVQVKQNTAAIQTSTSQDVYELHQQRTMAEMENPEFATLLLRVERRPDEVSSVDSLRYRRYLNLNMNLQEAVYSNALNGTLERDMAAGWLEGMSTVLCRPWMRDYWRERKGGYHAAFQAAMDSVAAIATC